MAASQVRTVEGAVTFRERIALPPGAVATVKLVDSTGEVLAGAAFDAAGVPAPFTLTVDPGLVDPAASLLLWAALRSDAGVWGTTDLVPIADGTTEVLVTRIDAD